MKEEIKQMIKDAWHHIKKMDIRGLVYFVKYNKVAIEFFLFLSIGAIYTIITIVTNYFIVDKFHLLQSWVWNTILVPPMFIVRFILEKMVFQERR